MKVDRQLKGNFRSSQCKIYLIRPSFGCIFRTLFEVEEEGAAASGARFEEPKTRSPQSATQVREASLEVLLRRRSCFFRNLVVFVAHDDRLIRRSSQNISRPMCMSFVGDTSTLISSRLSAIQTGALASTTTTTESDGCPLLFMVVR